MKMFIYSKFGVLECKEMGLQAIEDSIPTQTPFEPADSTENSPDEIAEE